MTDAIIIPFHLPAPPKNITECSFCHTPLAKCKKVFGDPTAALICSNCVVICKKLSEDKTDEVTP